MFSTIAECGVTLREERRLTVFKNTVFGNVFGSRMEELTRGWMSLMVYTQPFILSGEVKEALAS